MRLENIGNRVELLENEGKVKSVMTSMSGLGMCKIYEIYFWKSCKIKIYFDEYIATGPRDIFCLIYCCRTNICQIYQIYFFEYIATRPIYAKYIKYIFGKKVEQLKYIFYFKYEIYIGVNI